jgi:putative transcriptional regulator
MARITLDQIKALSPKIDRAKIEATTDEDILRQMSADGEEPSEQPSDYIEEVPPAQIRQQLQMTQVELARVLQIPVSTLRNWEQGRVRIDPAARALFRILKKDPEHALSALQPERRAS